MSDSERTNPKYQPYDPEGSPFVVHEIEGMPFKKNSEEMRAIKRVLARRKEREAARSNRK